MTFGSHFFSLSHCRPHLFSVMQTNPVFLCSTDFTFFPPYSLKKKDDSETVGLKPDTCLFPGFDFTIVLDLFV